MIAGLVLSACAVDDEPRPVTQEEYQDAARAFNEQQARYADEIVECAAERGVDVQRSWDHGVFLPPGLDRDQMEEQGEILFECATSVYPPDREPEADEVQDHYRHLLAARECLLEEGFDVGEAGDLDEFLAAYESGGTVLPWSPFTELTRDADVFRAAVEVCPQPGRH